MASTQLRSSVFQLHLPAELLIHFLNVVRSWHAVSRETTGVVDNWLGGELAFGIVGAVGNDERVNDGWGTNELGRDVVGCDVPSFRGFDTAGDDTAVDAWLGSSDWPNEDGWLVDGPGDGKGVIGKGV